MEQLTQISLRPNFKQNNNWLITDVDCEPLKNNSLSLSHLLTINIVSMLHCIVEAKGGQPITALQRGSVKWKKKSIFKQKRFIHMHLTSSYDPDACLADVCL